MKHITFYLDFISPYAHLAFEALPEALMGTSYSVRYTPVLFAGLLKHHGQLGPAEIASKRDWTYRQVLWLAHSRGIALEMPASHPFNPLALLRLALACSPESTPGMPNRYVCETIFRHVWRSGQDAGSAERVKMLAAQRCPAQDMLGNEVKSALKRNTDTAIFDGVFGVPAFVVDGKMFWGQDALLMLRDYLLNAPGFQNSGWESVSQVGVGTSRNAS